MTDAPSLMRAGFYCIVANVVAFVLAIAEGYTIDPMVTAMTNAGMRNVHSGWAAATDTVELIDIAYVLPYLISFIGIVYFIIVAVKRQRYDQYGNNLDLRY